MRISVRGTLTLAAVLSGIVAAPAMADTQYLLEAQSNYDGTWSVSGEQVVDPSNLPPASTGEIEVVRGGAVVASATGGADPTGFAEIDQDGSGAAAPAGLQLQPGDVIDYFDPTTSATPQASATFTGDPAIGADACAGATSFTATAPGAITVSGGAFTPSSGTDDPGTAAASNGGAYTVSLGAPLKAGDVATAAMTSALSTGSGTFDEDSARLADSCTAAPITGGSTSTGGVSSFGNSSGTQPPPPPLSLVVSVTKVRARSLAKLPMALTVSCARPCSATAALLASVKTAKRLKLTGSRAGGYIVLARSLTPLPTGAGIVLLRLSRHDRARIKRGRGRTLTLAVTVADATGETVSRLVSVKLA